MDAGIIVRVRSTDLFQDLYNREVVAHMYYDGLAAQMQGTATVTDETNSASFTLQSPIDRHFGFWSFFGNTFRYRWPVPIRHTCGTNLWASMYYRAWVDGFAMESGVVKFDEDDDERSGSRSQPPCGVREEEIDPPSDDGGSGGGPVEKPTDSDSYSKCVVRIRYDLQTGEIISWSVLYCY